MGHVHCEENLLDSCDRNTLLYKDVSRQNRDGVGCELSPGAPRSPGFRYWNLKYGVRNLGSEIWGPKSGFRGLVASCDLD
jgi:hypothetical protein